jgi:hypothetical protein
MPSPVLCLQSNFGEVEFWQYNELHLKVLRCFKAMVFQTTRVVISDFRIKRPTASVTSRPSSERQPPPAGIERLTTTPVIRRFVAELGVRRSGAVPLL